MDPATDNPTRTERLVPEGNPISGPLIVVADGWLANAGDAAILLAMRRSLTSAIPGARLVFCCHQHRLVDDRYPELELAAPLEALVNADLPWIDARDLASRESAERLVDAADLVIAPGGGFLFEHYRPEGRLATYEALLGRGKPLVFYSQSIGEFRDPSLRARLVAILRAARLVMARDRSSYEIARTWGGIEPLELTVDEAFRFPAERFAGSRDRGALLVTVSQHPWWAGVDDVTWLDAADLDAVGGALARLLESAAAERITLVSTTQGLGGARWALEDDLYAARAVAERMPASLASRVTVVPGYVSAGDYLRIASRHSAVMSMRMHGAILAAVAGTPALLVHGGAKAYWGSTEAAPGFETVRTRAELAALDERLRELLARRRSWKRRQQHAVAAMQRLAGANARLVADTL